MCEERTTSVWLSCCRCGCGVLASLYGIDQCWNLLRCDGLLRCCGASWGPYNEHSCVACGRAASARHTSHPDTLNTIGMCTVAVSLVQQADSTLATLYGQLQRPTGTPLAPCLIQKQQHPHPLLPHPTAGGCCGRPRPQRYPARAGPPQEGGPGHPAAQGATPAHQVGGPGPQCTLVQTPCLNTCAWSDGQIRIPWFVRGWVRCAGGVGVLADITYASPLQGAGEIRTYL